MFKFSTIILIATLIVLATSAYLSDPVKEFQFKKANDGSKEYNFEFTQDDGETFRGRTFIVNDPNSHIYIMFDAKNVTYWVQFTNDEYKENKTLTMEVRLVKRKKDRADFADDFVNYSLDYKYRSFSVTPYSTQWDLEKICFTQIVNGNQTFRYIMSATNNSRKFNGTTYTESDDKHVQRIHMVDGHQRNDVYEIVLTDQELNSFDTFCRGITKTISSSGVLGAYVIININPNLMDSLVG